MRSNLRPKGAYPTTRAKNKELIKSYIEKLDLSPRKMAEVILSLNDKKYVEEYINTHENIDIHLKYLLAMNLPDKTILEGITSRMISITDLTAIDLNSLIEHEEYQYIQIAGASDVKRILGIDEIYTREQMISILEKIEEMLKDIPTSTNGDLVEDTIIFKKIYEAYIKDTEYDEEAIKEEKNDWRRNVRCRNLIGAFSRLGVTCFD